VTASKSAIRAFVRFRVCADSAERGEAALADAFESGASGVEELDAESALIWDVYAPASAARSVANALRGHAPAVDADEAVAVPQEDWSERWKQGLETLLVSPRLCVRPSCVAALPEQGRAELVIDPGQAFGIGGHASTRLALEWIDACAAEWTGSGRVLDVGCGTGVLALAALRLGAETGIGIDLDPLATEAARDNAVANGLAGRAHFVLGPITALGTASFELVVANLLCSEMLPLLDEIALRVRAGGAVVLSGLLEPEAARVAAACNGLGLRSEGWREHVDANGDCWVGLLMRR
jgi:ribosomal protein L11 methyltransferase